MSFGVTGQYKMAVTIDKYEDFLTEDKFEKFILIENIGLSLPYFELKFTCVIPQLLKYFNEKQKVLVQIGTSTKDLEPIELVIKKPIIVPQSTDSSIVTLRGFINMLPYLDTEVKAVYKDSTSYDVLKTIAKKHGLKFVSNMDSTDDKMTYYQPAITDYKMAYEAWLHSKGTKSSLLMPSINTKMQLVYNSVTQQIADLKNPITFTDSAPDKDEIRISANNFTESNTTMSNMFGNYMKDRYVFHKDTGIFEHIHLDNNKPIISESKTNSVDDSISKSSGFYVQNANVHKDYYKQELLNTQRYFTIQASKQWVSVPDIYVKNAYPGDLVMFSARGNNGQVNDEVSGLYMVSRRVLSIKDRQVHTNFLLTRENMNYSK